MVQSGINPAHQPPGIKSSISWPQNIPQEPVSQGCSSYVGQLHGSSLSQQQRRHPLSSSDVLNSGNRTWCLQRNILISAQHVPGKENTVADSESLTFLDSTDWQLDPTVITPFLTNWNTDLFASRLTAQLRQYLKAYESAWSRWSRWCAKGKINPISAPLSKILDFLANAFSDGLVYRSINVLSSAISSTHSRIDNFLVGQHPHVTKLIKGVLNSCPPKPRYSYTWDVKKATAIRRSCFLPYFSKKAWQP